MNRTPAEERERDLYMLEELLQFPVGTNVPGARLDVAHRESLTSKEQEAFFDMHDRLHEPGGFRTLHPNARSWVEDACERLCVNTTPTAQRRPIPRGREVPLAEVLRELPMRPPRSVR